jgi:signal transduction histidine kinase
VVAARAGDGWLEITISDTGPGIPADQLEQPAKKPSAEAVA